MCRVSNRPTIREVAEQAGVSIATVSRVLNDRADVVRSSLEAFVVKRVPIEQVVHRERV